MVDENNNVTVGDYLFFYRNGELICMDSNGDIEFSVYDAERHIGDLTEDNCVWLLYFYQKTYRHGNTVGYNAAQHDIRRALGIQN